MIKVIFDYTLRSFYLKKKIYAKYEWEGFESSYEYTFSPLYIYNARHILDLVECFYYIIQLKIYTKTAYKSKVLFLHIYIYTLYGSALD